MPGKFKSRTLVITLSLSCMLAIGAVAGVWFGQPSAWSSDELKTLQSLWLGSLPALPADPTNRVADDPRAQALGHALFFDTRLSGNGAISCATCHQPQFRFTDRLPLSRAIGTTKRNAPSIIGVAYSPWLYWDGRKDSLWSQALAPLEDSAEHGGSRMQYVHLIANDEHYKSSYEALFGPLPELHDQTRFPAAAGPVDNPEWHTAWQAMTPSDRDLVNRVYTNMGKAIAAYERLLQPSPARFDAYAQAVLSSDDESAEEIYSRSERRGLRLFMGAAACTQCHNGPLFTNNAFHNTGMLSIAGAVPDIGRASGLRKLLADPFNCLGAYSDDATNCSELLFANPGDDNVGAMRAPSLRNLGHTEPYAHAGQQSSLDDVLAHYNTAPDAMIGHNEAKPLNLWPWQIDSLKAFLATLDAAPATPAKWLAPPQLATTDD